LRFGGHTDDVLRRYLTMTLQDVAAALHAPQHGGPAARRRWLDRIAERRGATSTSALEREVEQAIGERGDGGRRIAAAARRIHQWRQEMVDGAREHPNR